MKHVLLSLSGEVMPKRAEPRGDRELVDRQTGKKQQAKCGSIFFFFFHWHYSPLWPLACQTIPFHFSLSITNSLHLLTPNT